MTAELLGATYNMLHHPSPRACSRGDVTNFILVVCAVNLQRISDLLAESWAFSLAWHGATHQSCSYNYIIFRIHFKSINDICNAHVCALPMFDRHNGQVMFEMTPKLLDDLCPTWRSKLLSVSSDCARNMTGRFNGMAVSTAWSLFSEQPSTIIALSSIFGVVCSSSTS